MASRQTISETIAKLLIIDNQNRVLILTLGKHLKYPEKSFLPDLPGGFVDPGESEQAAAIRETQEECGIDIDPKNVQLAFVETAFYKKENKSVTKMLYVTHIEDAPKITLSWEHSDYKWVTISELRTIELRPFFKRAVEYLIVHTLV